MNSIHALAEALVRIEHKVDIALSALRKANPILTIPSVGDFNHTCPVCQQQVTYMIDSLARILVRKCGCKTGLQPPIDLESFAPPGGKRYGREDSDNSDGIWGQSDGVQGPRGGRR